MDIRGWDERYRSRERASEDIYPEPTPLLVKTASPLRPGEALDLASGAGRNSLWLASQGWKVWAVDGSGEAIEILVERVRQSHLTVKARVADLNEDAFDTEAQRFDLVVIAYYLQRSLFEKAKAVLKPGGRLLAIAHTAEGTEQPTESRLSPGELRNYFSGWEILHYYEGKPNDPAHKRSVAEIVARRPIH